MLVSPAYADEMVRGGSGSLLLQLVPFLLIFVVMYFLMIRPQQKRAAAHQQALSAMKRGDRVVTNSGLVGTIVRVKESEFILEIAENVQVTIVKQAVASLYGSSTTQRKEVSTETKKGSEVKV